MTVNSQVGLLLLTLSGEHMSVTYLEFCGRTGM